MATGQNFVPPLPLTQPTACRLFDPPYPPKTDSFARDPLRNHRHLAIAPGRVGRILTQPLERGRSPPAARRSVEGFWTIPESLRRISRCGPGRSAVRRWWYPDAPNFQLPGGLTAKPAQCYEISGHHPWPVARRNYLNRIFHTPIEW